MSGPDPIVRDVARERALRRLPSGALCVLCGERDPEALTQRPSASVPTSVLEAHHLGGRANDPDLTVVLCLNCHRRISARMPAFGVQLGTDSERTSPERLVSVLRGLAVFFEQLAHSLMGWARELTESDADQPRGGNHS